MALQRAAYHNQPSNPQAVGNYFRNHHNPRNFWVINTLARISNVGGCWLNNWLTRATLLFETNQPIKVVISNSYQCVNCVSILHTTHAGICRDLPRRAVCVLWKRKTLRLSAQGLCSLRLPLEGCHLHSNKHWPAPFAMRTEAQYSRWIPSLCSQKRQCIRRNIEKPYPSANSVV